MADDIEKDNLENESSNIIDDNEEEVLYCYNCNKRISFHLYVGPFCCTDCFNEYYDKSK